MSERPTPITDDFCAKLSKSKKTDWEKWQLTASHAANLERQLAEAIAYQESETRWAAHYRRERK